MSDKTYGAYKVSDRTHQNYRVDESDGVPARQQTTSDLEKIFEQAADIDFNKKHTKRNDNEEFKAEYKTTKDALKELSFFTYKTQLQQIQALTPEEYETIILCIDELKVNSAVYALQFGAATAAFAYWQRRFIPRSFMAFSIFMGVAAGFAYSTIRTGWFVVEKVDSLGKEYEISRLMKQDIFDTRPDLDSSTRANYYMYQQKENDEYTDRKKANQAHR